MTTTVAGAATTTVAGAATTADDDAEARCVTGVDTPRDTKAGPLTREALATIVVGALVFVIAARPAIDNDLWFHLRTARWMLDHHRWVGVDPFTHTRPGVVRVQTDWLSQLGYYGVWRWAGLLGVALVVATIATAAMLILFKNLQGSAGVRGGVVLLTAATSSIFWSARPQMVTFLGTVVVVALLHRWRRQPDRRLLWWLVPLFLVWVNAHGGVIYGVMILAGGLAGEVLNRLARRPHRMRGRALRRLGAVTTACVAVLAVNPSGGRVYGLPFHQVASSTQFVQEYQPPSPADPTALPFFLMLALAIGLLVWHWRAWDGAELVLVGMAASFALQFTRSIPLFAVVAAPVLARHLSVLRGASGSREPIRDRRPADRGELAVASLIAVGVLGLAVSRAAPDEARLEAEFPVSAVQWMNQHQPPGELFNTFDWGGYVMWEAPAYPVSIDGRTDVYDEYLDVYADTIEAEAGWGEELDREHVGTVLVDPALPLTGALRADPGWQVAYEDPVAVVFTRTL